MCHLAIEKMLKAHISALSVEPPVKTHNQLHLIKNAALELPAEMLEFAGKINTASVPTRYPDALSKMAAAIDKRVAEGYLEQTETVIGWLTAARVLEPVEATGLTPAEIQRGDISPFWKHVLEHEAQLLR